MFPKYYTDVENNYAVTLATAIFKKIMLWLVFFITASVDFLSRGSESLHVLEGKYTHDS